MAEFNLVRERWIPCVAGGTLSEESLLDTLTNAHTFSSVVDACPPVTASLHRLLLALLHRVFGPADQGQWEAMWNSNAFDGDALARYLEEWEGNFDLFSASNPFYQDAGLSGLELERLSKPISWIMHEKPRLNSPTLFDHTNVKNPTVLNAAEAARRLITFQSFALPGMITQENGKLVSGTAAPLVDHAVFLAMGANLFETLMLNMVKYDPEADLPFPVNGIDLPAWENPNSSARGSRLPTGYLDWLTWQPRQLLLAHEESDTGIEVRAVRVHLGASLPAGVSTEGFENMVAYIGRKNKPRKPVMFKEGRGLWRDFYATVEAFKETRSDEARVSPKVLQWLGSLTDDGVLDDRVIPLAAMGLSKDPANAAKVWLWQLDSLSLPLLYLTDSDLAAVCRKALGTVEAVGGVLSTSYYYLVREIDPDAQVTSFRNPYYWTQAEVLFRKSLVEMVQGDSHEVLASFAKEIGNVATKDFDLTVATMGNQARVLKACAQQRARLARGVNKAIGGKS